MKSVVDFYIEKYEVSRFIDYDVDGYKDGYGGFRLASEAETGTNP